MWSSRPAICYTFTAFWFWQVKSLEEAIEWVKRCPVYEGQISSSLASVETARRTKEGLRR
jgi:hypothetical protein